MRSVLRNHDEVCHFWANKKQDSGKASRMFFENDTIYSYGHHFPIARHVNSSTILFTTRDYSVSTSQHKAGVRSAIPHNKTVLYIYDVDSARINRNHLNNFIEQKIEKSKKARSKKEYYIGEAIEAFNQYLKAHPYLDENDKKEHNRFVNKWKAVFANKEDISTEYNNQVLKEAIARKRDQQRRDKKQLELLDKWVRGENVIVSYQRTPYDKMRIKDNHVETSMSVRVPIKDAKVLWALIKRNKPIHGHVIDGYTVISYVDDILTIGCHKFEKSEVERIGKLLDYIKE